MQVNKNKTYRDRPEFLDEKGKRKWIYARKPKGVWYNRRSIVAYLLLLFFIAAPIIQVNGHPFMLLDVMNRKFHLFGATVYSQDTDIMAIVMVTVVVFIVLFTVVFGRFWCGWTCPHTVFLEMVYRRIEYLFHGNYRSKPKEINFLLQSLKHTIYFTITLFFTNVFIMWFTGLPKLIEIWQSPVSEHWQVYMAMLIITIFYYWIYSTLRESVCTLFCPYGRMQGVLLDSKSITVAYDYKRGEPRGAKAKGDCIDCASCIAVCPTGIDIRNGTQLECVNCTACIDECNLVMKKLNRPKNLIRFASKYSIETEKNSIKNARTYAYAFVLVVLMSFLILALKGRTEVDASLLRIPGTIYQEVGTDTISNIYQFKVVNKTEEQKTLYVKILKPEKASFFLAEYPVLLKENSFFSGIAIIKFAKKDINKKNNELTLGIYQNDKLLESISTNFIFK